VTLPGTRRSEGSRSRLCEVWPADASSGSGSAWRIDGYFEHLSVVGDPAASPAARVDRLLDVSDSRAWGVLTGAVLDRRIAEAYAIEPGGGTAWGSDLADLR
jgi:hypothetical protein